MSLVDKAKEVIKQYIRECPVGGVANIPIENVAENVSIFERALSASDIQRMLVQQDKRVQFQFIEPGVDQAKRHILHYIRGASSHIRQIVFPCLRQDAADYYAALQSEEVQSALTRSGITAQVRTVQDNKPIPDILIASIDDVKNGNLNAYLKQFDP